MWRVNWKLLACASNLHGWEQAQSFDAILLVWHIHLSGYSPMMNYKKWLTKGKSLLWICLMMSRFRVKQQSWTETATPVHVQWLVYLCVIKGFLIWAALNPSTDCSTFSPSVLHGLSLWLLKRWCLNPVVFPLPEPECSGNRDMTLDNSHENIRWAEWSCCFQDQGQHFNQSIINRKKSDKSSVNGTIHSHIHLQWANTIHGFTYTCMCLTGDHGPKLLGKAPTPEWMIYHQLPQFGGLEQRHNVDLTNFCTFL